MQACGQVPSPPVALVSHCSPASRTPLPQTAKVGLAAAKLPASTSRPSRRRALALRRTGPLYIELLASLDGRVGHVAQLQAGPLRDDSLAHPVLQAALEAAEVFDAGLRPDDVPALDPVVSGRRVSEVPPHADEGVLEGGIVGAS